MKKLLVTTTLVIALSQLAACAITKEQGGALTGAVVGGVVGNQIGGGRGKDLATAAGIIGGAIAGASVGKTLDQLDAANIQRALETSPSNQTSSWVNPDSGNRYSLTPTHTYQNTTNRYCREYQTTVTVAGDKQDGYGTACRQPDGNWEVL